jgi:F-type H+-transporting ATPase subunit a
MYSLGLTRFLNHLFGGLIASLLNAMGIACTPATAINDSLALEMLVVFGLIVFFLVVRLTLSVEKPNSAQQIAELIHGFTGGQAEQVIGPGYQRFQAFTTCILLFVVCNNLLGLIPGINTPTAEPVVPLGIATLAFVYYNFHGVRVHGPLGYLKELSGPVAWLTPLMFPVEIISHLARVMSLTIRLYANMLASDLLTLICFSMIPLLAPTAFLGLHLFVSLIQAYVFMLLTMIYLSMAIVREE